MALHGDIKVNGQDIGSWSAQRVITKESGRHTYRWESVQGRERSGGYVDHYYDDGAMALASKVMALASAAKVMKLAPEALGGGK